MCRLVECRKPARFTGPNPSKYCSDEHGLEFMRQKCGLPNPNFSAQLSSQRPKSMLRTALNGSRTHTPTPVDDDSEYDSHIEDEQDTGMEDLGSRGGVLTLGDLAAVIMAVGSAEEFRKLGSHIVSPPPSGFGMSQRAVTVSTVGVVPAIHRLAEEGLQVTLAVSLHTPDDELRDTLVPVNNRWPVTEVMDAARHYADATGRRVSIEYALIRDVNDQTWRGEMLGRLLAQRLGAMAHVNLIPLNPTPGSEWDASPKHQQDAFVDAVRAAGGSCTVRDTRGQEIAAACGQLAAED